SEIPIEKSPPATSPYNTSNLFEVLAKTPFILTFLPMRALKKGFSSPLLASLELRA
ncbi:8127_t:CDS:1, partial [Ambispora leptoticha]